jgi:hypothetical protein
MPPSFQPSHTDYMESVRRLIERDQDALILAEAETEAETEVRLGRVGHRRLGRLARLHVPAHRLVVVPSQQRRGLWAASCCSRPRPGAVRCEAMVVGTDRQAVDFWRASGREQQAERLPFVADCPSWPTDRLTG